MQGVNISRDVESVLDTVTAIRRDLHAHPELGFEEVRTSGVVAERLRTLGLEPITGIAETGVTTLIEGGAGDGPTLLLRADMDALPIQEANDHLDYRSTVPGKMHACGHDGHTAMLLGVAEVLQRRRESLRGRVRLVFQPAEEAGGGGRRMVEAGVLNEPRVDHAFGLHLWSTLDCGRVEVSPGPVMASSDGFDIHIEGRGGHAAKPDQTVDPVVVAAHLITALQTVVSRNRDPLQSAVISVTQVHGGDTFNVIPDQVRLNGTCRAFDPAVQELIERRMRELVETLPAAFGARGRLDYRRGYPVTVNDSAAAELVRAAAGEVVGEAQVQPFPPTMGAEDFSYFLREVPGCFFMVGARNEAEGIDAPHHNPKFNIDERALGIGVETMVRVVERLLG